MQALLQLLKDFLTALAAYLAGRGQQAVEDKSKEADDNAERMARVVDADADSRAKSHDDKLRFLREHGLL